ncbi:MAG: S9 family peptidase [Flavobacteriaceae bacterium]
MRTLSILSLSLSLLWACQPNKKMVAPENIHPPRADKIPYQHKKHNDIRIDPYYWLRERDNPEVIDYLERENHYYQQMTAHREEEKKSLFEEMKSRIKENDTSVPYFFNGYWYSTRFEEGKAYPIYTRKKDSLTAQEEILFDCNAMAKGKDYFQLKGINVSPDNTKVAFGVDLVSRRQYTIQIKDLLSQKMLDTKIINTSGGSVWDASGRYLFYTHVDPKTLRSEKIFRHDSQSPQIKDALVYEELDATFSVGVGSTKSRKYITIFSYSTLTSEQQFLEAENPLGDFQTIQKRQRGLEYSAAHFGDYFYITTNADGAANFKVMKTPTRQPSKKNWEEWIPHREDVLIEDLDLFQDYWVMTERKNGLTQMKVAQWDGEKSYYLPLEGQTYTAYTGYNPQFETDTLRFVYNSLKTPSSVFDFNMKTKEQILLKKQDVLDTDFDSTDYIEERIWAPARDGKRIPVSLIYHKDTKLSPHTPLLQYAYGSYGSTIDPNFSSTRLSLLNRGFIYAIAHVRGGEYLGRQWYEDGKLMTKKNTFTDFIDCSRYLIDLGYTSAEHLYAYGGSAGGLLIGAVINEAPDLYNGAIAAVPFVDVVTTMLDESIPLTTYEYDEWGNPNEKKYYEYMKSYSPYDQVKAQAYPHLFVTTGYHDSQVQYWEPAKWVARLREIKTDERLLFLDTNMKAGHGGASGRYASLMELAKKYSFLLQLEAL